MLRIVRNRETAEDITIEAFWRIYRARTRFDPSRDFAPWARRIATNLALTELQAHAREVPLEEDFPAADSAISLGIGREIRGSIARLPVTLRVVAILALIEDRPHREIGEALGLSENAVKMRVFRAVRLLRRDLTAKDITP